MAEPPDSPDPRHAFPRVTTGPGLAGCLTGLGIGAGVVAVGGVLIWLTGAEGGVRRVLEVLLAGLALGSALLVWRVSAAASAWGRHAEMDGTALREEGEDPGRD